MTLLISDFFMFIAELGNVTYIVSKFVAITLCCHLKGGYD